MNLKIATKNATMIHKRPKQMLTTPVFFERYQAGKSRVSQIDAVRKNQDFVDITETVDQHSAFIFNAFEKLNPSKTLEKVSPVTYMNVKFDG